MHLLLNMKMRPSVKGQITNQEELGELASYHYHKSLVNSSLQANLKKPIVNDFYLYHVDIFILYYLPMRIATK